MLVSCLLSKQCWPVEVFPLLKSTRWAMFSGSKMLAADPLSSVRWEVGASMNHSWTIFALWQGTLPGERGHSHQEISVPWKGVHGPQHCLGRWCISKYISQPPIHVDEWTNVPCRTVSSSSHRLGMVRSFLPLSTRPFYQVKQINERLLKPKSVCLFNAHLAYDARARL